MRKLRPSLVAIAALCASLVATAPAMAQSVKIVDGPGATPVSEGGQSGFLHAGFDGANGQVGFCGYNSFGPGWYYISGPLAPGFGAEGVEDCPDSATVVLGEGVPGGPDGLPGADDLPDPGDPPSLDELPAPPSGGGGGAPGARECQAAGGADATCVDDPTGAVISQNGDVGYILVQGDASPQGEVGFCNRNAAFPAFGPGGGRGYYHVRGPSDMAGTAGGEDSGGTACPDQGSEEPDGDMDGVPDTEDECPAEPGPASNQGCPVEPPADTDGDGVADEDDNCVGVTNANQANNDGDAEGDACDADDDNDTVLDGTDRCPTQAGPAANDGCPQGGNDPDGDGDGVVGTDDDCPAVPGPASNQGCPEPPDGDGDGIIDEDDSCPAEPGPDWNDGCPVPPPTDTDGDGVPDADDECVDEPGPASNQGCPEDPPPPTDTDGDGVPDADDDCPAEPGPAANQGCPVPTGGGDPGPGTGDPGPGTGGPGTGTGGPGTGTGPGDPGPGGGDTGGGQPDPGTTLPAPPAGADAPQGDEKKLAACLKKAKKVKDPKKRRKARERCHERFGDK